MGEQNINESASTEHIDNPLVDGHPYSVCPNCSHNLSEKDHYCSSCGQANHDIKVSFGHIMFEFFEGFTHLDGKLFNTLRAIFVKPGKLTVDYLEGKRARYIPPPRFYLAISVIFFLLLNIFMHKKSEENDRKKEKDFVVEYQGQKFLLSENQWKKFLNAENSSRGDSILYANNNPISTDRQHFRQVVMQALINHQYNRCIHKCADVAFTKSKIDSLVGLDSTATAQYNTANFTKKNEECQECIEEMKQFNEELYCGTFTVGVDNITINNVNLSQFDKESIKHFNNHQLDSFLIAKGDEPGFFNRQIYRTFNKDKNIDTVTKESLKMISPLMFILMPLVAFLTWLLFRRKWQYYVEHLVFSINLHASIFLIFIILLLINTVMPISLLNKFAFIGINIYILMSIKYVFDDTWKKTMLKSTFLFTVYWFLSMLIILGAVGYSLIFK